MVAKLVTWSVTLAAVAALSLVGRSGQGPAAEPGESLERMLVAMGNREYEDACRLTAQDGAPVEDGAALTDCVATMRVYAEGLRPESVQGLRQVSVPDVAATGSQVEIPGARIAGVSQPFADGSFVLVRIDDRWYVVVATS
ncbi:hypothetical protein [Mumia zhuanghuii]|uniref:Nuclear transport factor 2 family protein n=1 Tax=Mumia zhuanghuii TaxID=2585211 RepID=A0A5C4MNH5_9ACTN|nr:hypothetical protein [Mumia zhuanghuii]TNC46810.1 hypothetical protein FHE65_11545 [Mumia zhuanghuii]TNC47142.1 hypothetical protein FHE65_11040 [Mumia zhuanghuii]